MSGWSLERLLAGLHGEIELRLQRTRAAIGHPVAKGDAAEGIWIELLTNYLPRRYRVAKAFVIDSTDTTSQQLESLQHRSCSALERYPEPPSTISECEISSFQDIAHDPPYRLLIEPA
jgi:hypothetical protein